MGALNALGDSDPEPGIQLVAVRLERGAGLGLERLRGGREVRLKPPARKPPPQTRRKPRDWKVAGLAVAAWV